MRVEEEEEGEGLRTDGFRNNNRERKNQNKRTQ